MHPLFPPLASRSRIAATGRCETRRPRLERGANLEPCLDVLSIPSDLEMFCRSSGDGARELDSIGRNSSGLTRPRDKRTARRPLQFEAEVGPRPMRPLPDHVMNDRLLRIVGKKRLSDGRADVTAMHEVIAGEHDVDDVPERHPSTRKAFAVGNGLERRTGPPPQRVEARHDPGQAVDDFVRRCVTTSVDLNLIRSIERVAVKIRSARPGMPKLSQIFERRSQRLRPSEDVGGDVFHRPRRACGRTLPLVLVNPRCLYSRSRPRLSEDALITT